MSIQTILVHTQYFENKAFYEGGEAFRPKGGHTFKIEMDADLLLYTDPAGVFGKMLESQNSDLERFEYVEHEIQWQEPTVLGTQDDYVKANQDLEEEPKEIKGGVIGGVDFTDNIDQLNNLSIL